MFYFFTNRRVLFLMDYRYTRRAQPTSLRVSTCACVCLATCSKRFVHLFLILALVAALRCIGSFDADKGCVPGLMHGEGF